MNYFAIYEFDGTAHGGLVPQLNVSAVGKNREQVLERLRQGIALALHDLGEVPPNQHDRLPDDLQEFAAAETLFLEPAEMNPVSVEVERAVQASGLTDSELARRMGTSPAAVGRMQDYFYWGHSLATLRKLADALGIKLEISLAA
ncbi:helix-turn-helix domain-containing protein [Deinococcus cavernae]|uniref:helix-turn-helix domain-containing protein n=1 Tax=Deinococcus cavernae TaxID=2320857 RepID=UPI001313E65D|nr:helix-turn-helix transcriptional regulator [Deinococcus cavernae]